MLRSKCLPYLNSKCKYDRRFFASLFCRFRSYIRHFIPIYCFTIRNMLTAVSAQARVMSEMLSATRQQETLTAYYVLFQNMKLKLQNHNFTCWVNTGAELGLLVYGKNTDYGWSSNDCCGRHLIVN